MAKKRAKKAKRPQSNQQFVAIRFTRAEKKACKAAADRYAGGNLSEWMRIAGANFKPRPAHKAFFA